MKVTAHAVMRDRLLARAGIHPPPKMRGASFESLAQECKDGFCEKMDNRIVMGQMRYGPMARKKPLAYDLNRAFRLLEKYRETGNDEMLVDAANYCRLEFLRGIHPKKHFHAIDR